MATLFDYPSKAELRDLIANKDYVLAKLAAAFANIAPVWTKRNPVEEARWYSDYTSMQSRYGAAKADAEDSMSWPTLLPDTMVDASYSWEMILRSLQKVENYRSPGDLADLIERGSKAGMVLNFSNAPQPKIENDFDLWLFKKADKGVNAIEKAGKALTSTSNHALLFGLAGAAIAIYLMKR